MVGAVQSRHKFGIISILHRRSNLLFKEESLLPLRPSIPLFCLALCSAAQAAPTAETEAAFQHAIQIAEANQQWINLIVEQEKTGRSDRQTQTQAILEMTQNNQAYEEELRKASAGGHAVATYLLANLQEGSKTSPSQDSVSRHAEAWALYQSAAGQGLMAGAVMLLRECENGSLRFKLDDPELLRLRDQLIKALEQPDPYSDYYPLPAINSFCFKEQKMIAINRERPVTALMDFYAPLLLSLEQFRADGYYLLTVKGDIESPKARDYFNQMQALTPDCLDPISMGFMFKVMDEKKR